MEKKIRTTVADDSTAKPLELVKRDFSADPPNRLWIADFTYGTTWLDFVYVAFVIDIFSRTTIGWRASWSMSTELTLDGLEQALWARQVNKGLFITVIEAANIFLYATMRGLQERVYFLPWEVLGVPTMML